MNTYISALNMGNLNPYHVVFVIPGPRSATNPFSAILTAGFPALDIGCLFSSICSFFINIDIVFYTFFWILIFCKTFNRMTIYWEALGKLMLKGGKASSCKKFDFEYISYCSCKIGKQIVTHPSPTPTFFNK